MGNKLTDEELAEVRQMMNEHRHGVWPDTGEVFAPRQKWLSHSELEAVRQMITTRAAVDAGVKVVERAAKYANSWWPPLVDGPAFQVETQLKTSELLSRAANIIEHNVPTTSKAFVRQLYDRAAAFKRTGELI